MDCRVFSDIDLDLSDGYWIVGSVESKAGDGTQLTVDTDRRLRTRLSINRNNSHLQEKKETVSFTPAVIIYPSIKSSGPLTHD